MVITQDTFTLKKNYKLLGSFIFIIYYLKYCKKNKVNLTKRNETNIIVDMFLWNKIYCINQMIAKVESLDHSIYWYISSHIKQQIGLN